MLSISYLFFRTLAKKFNFNMREKTYDKHFQDTLDLIVYGSVVYFFNFLNNKISIDFSYIITFYISLLLFGFFLKIPGVGETVPNIRKWNKNKIIFTLLFTILVFYLNNNNKIFSNQNKIFLFSLFLYLLTLFFKLYKKDKYKTFHPHHWQIFWFLSLLIKPNDIKTKILSSIFLSMFSHGIICYSAAPIYKDE